MGESYPYWQVTLSNTILLGVSDNSDIRRANSVRPYRPLSGFRVCAINYKAKPRGAGRRISVSLRTEIAPLPYKIVPKHKFICRGEHCSPAFFCTNYRNPTKLVFLPLYLKKSSHIRSVKLNGNIACRL